MAQKKKGFSGNVVLRQYDSLSDPRVLVTGLDQSEIATLEGDRFSFSYDVVIPQGEAVYIYGKVPTGSDITAGFQKRILKSESGPIDFNVRWDSVVGTLGASIPAFNENNAFRTANPSVLELNVVDPVNVTDDGIIREYDFIAGSGVGNNSTGDVSPESGYRIYVEDTDFLLEIINTHSSSNRVLVGYSWIEAPTSFLGE